MAKEPADTGMPVDRSAVARGNVINFARPQAVRSSMTYDDALKHQKGADYSYSAEESQYEWLMQLVSKQFNLSKAAIRIGVVVTAVEFKMGRFDWPTTKYCLGALGYTQAALDSAFEELRRCGLMSPGAANNTAAHR
jgi:hypothetical protein